MNEYPPTTKERILETAGDIFGREGFKATTIRRIAEAAQVNVAAINYHFRDKEGLYAAVLEHVFHSGFTKFPSSMGIAEDTPPEQQLLFFIKGMFYRLLSDDGWGGLSGRGRLIARELVDPSPAFDVILDTYIKPHKDLLLRILIAIIGKNPGPRKLMPCAISIIGQCIYYALATPVIRKISEENIPDKDNLDRLAEFVWLFSLGGIEKISSDEPSAADTDNAQHRSTPFSPIE
jgi:AcrR family transcriptional regulator